MKFLALLLTLSGCALDMNGTEFWHPVASDASPVETSVVDPAAVDDPPATDAAPAPVDAPTGPADAQPSPPPTGPVVCPAPFMVNPSAGGPPCIL